MILETQRMTLREFDMNDLSALGALMSSPEMMKHSYRGPQTLEETKAQIGRFQNRYRRDGSGPWAAIEKKSGKLIGFCGLPVQPVEGKSELEVGYGFSAEFQGQGFAQEGTQACRDYGFKKLGKERLVSLISVGNEASVHVAEKMGMKLIKRVEFYGREVLLYAITRKEWILLTRTD